MSKIDKLRGFRENMHERKHKVIHTTAKLKWQQVGVINKKPVMEDKDKKPDDKKAKEKPKVDKAALEASKQLKSKQLANNEKVTKNGSDLS